MKSVDLGAILVSIERDYVEVLRGKFATRQLTIEGSGATIDVFATGDIWVSADEPIDRNLMRLILDELDRQERVDA